MVNIRRRRGTTYEGGKPQQTYLGPEPAPDRLPMRRGVVDEPKAEQPLEMIDAPDQFIDTESVNFIPIQSANGAIRSVLF